MFSSRSTDMAFSASGGGVAYPNGRTPLKKLTDRVLPVDETAGKLRRWVANIPPYAYWLAALALLIGIGFWIYNHILIQFTWGPRRGKEKHCGGRPKTTGLFQIGGGGNLAYAPNVNVVLGRGHPVYHKQQIIAEAPAAVVVAAQPQPARVPEIVVVPAADKVVYAEANVALGADKQPVAYAVPYEAPVQEQGGFKQFMKNALTPK